MEWVGLKNAVVPVTGAASGIGLAICRQLRAQGATPLLIDVDEDKLHAAAQMVWGSASARPGRCAWVLDVRDSAAVDACLAAIRGEHGVPTHAVANAGIGQTVHALEVSDEDWHRIIDVNLHGVMYFCRAAGRQLAEAGRGSIVTMASIGGLLTKRGRAPYAASKAAVINLTRALALDLADRGVRVNAVAPGVVDTPLQRHNSEQWRAAAMGRVPLARAASPDEIAGATLFLMSDAASYITGHTLVVDGGLTAGYA